MRIAHFIADDVDPFAARGVPRSVYYTALYQAKVGNDMAIFCIPRTKAVAPPDVKVFQYARPRSPFAMPEGMVKDLESWQPDVIHMQSAYTPVLATLAKWARKRGIPYVSTPRGALSKYVTQRRWYLKYPYKMLFELNIMNNAAFVQALTDQDDIKEYGVTAPIIPLPNGFLLDELPDNPNPELLAERYPQVKGKRVFSFLGRIDPYHKGLDLLLEGWSIARPENAILVLMGPDREGSIEEVKVMAANYGFSDQLIMTGPVIGEDKYHYLSASDIFVHTTRWEGGIPHSMMEAAASNLPGLLSFAPDRLGLFQKHNASIKVELNAQDVARGITEFVTMDEAELKAMGKRARNVIETEFDWENIARKIVDAYRTYANITT